MGRRCGCGGIGVNGRNGGGIGGPLNGGTAFAALAPRSVILRLRSLSSSGLICQYLHRVEPLEQVPVRNSLQKGIPFTVSLPVMAAIARAKLSVTSPLRL
jgi:hypothetical protein